MLAKHALYQLSYGPLARANRGRTGSIWAPARRLVGPGRFELPTSRLSGVRSNQLSYGPSRGGKARLAGARGAWRLGGSRSHRSTLLVRTSQRPAMRERETKTATSRLIFYRRANSFLVRELWRLILRKEVIQPQVPLRLPCYDFTPVADPTVVVRLPCGLTERLRVKPTPMV